MRTSAVEKRKPVTFPEFTGERAYMIPFTKNSGLPFDLARWQPTVDGMLDGIDVAGPIYLMVDQSVVQRGFSQRRPGVHVDGQWFPERNVWDNPPRWYHAPQLEGVDAQGILLASDVQGCTAWVGDYEAEPGLGGAFDHLDLSRLTAVPLTSGYCWAGDAAQMLHASTPVPATTERTLVRLVVSGWTPSMNGCATNEKPQ